MNVEKKKQLQIQASEIREKTVNLIYHGGGGHIGGDLSETDIMVVLFDRMKHDPQNPGWEGRDYFIASLHPVNFFSLSVFSIVGVKILYEMFLYISAGS